MQLYGPVCRTLSLLVIAASFGLMELGAAATCTIFSDRDYKGSHWTLRNGDDMKMIATPQLGTSDGIHRFLYEPSWNDKVSSFKVDPGCTLTLWEDVNNGGHHFRSNRSYLYVGDRWNDKASEAICECAGLPNW